MSRRPRYRPQGWSSPCALIDATTSRIFARWRSGDSPGPIFHYIDGAADDEVTYRRNTEAYERCDLVPNVLAGVESIDMSTTVLGRN